MASTAAGPSSSSRPRGTASLTSSTPDPRNKPIDLAPLKELLKENLLDALVAIPGGKTLVLDRDLAGSLGLVVDVGSLKNQAVEKMFWLEPGPLQAPTRNIVYLTRPSRSHLEIIADQIKTHQSQQTQGYVYHVLFAPRRTALSASILEELGIGGDVEVKELGLGASWIVLEDDLMSLEKEPSVIKDLYLNGDDTPLYDASMALMTFQRAYGLFPRMLGKGDAAQRLVSLLKRHRESRPDIYSTLEPSQQVDGLIVIDRSTDWVTPMMTMLTYEGLLAEYVGIQRSHIEVDPELLSTEANRPPPGESSNPISSTLGAQGSSNRPTKKRKHLLSASTDPLFGELRDSNFSVVGAKLARLARRLEADYQGKNSLDTVGKMKEFVGKLGGLQGEQRALKLHTSLTEMLMSITRSPGFEKVLEIQQNIATGYEPTNQMTAIEDLMIQQSQTPWDILRLVILLSLSVGGIRQKVLDNFKREFLQIYGYHYLTTFVNLERMGLLNNSPAPGGNIFPQTRKSLRLWVEEANEQEPNDIAYTYSGYAPLSIRLVQCVSMKPAVLATATGGSSADRNGKARQPSEADNEPARTLPRAHGLMGWKGFEDTMASLPGLTVDESQRSLQAAAVPSDRDGGMKTTLVFFLGGCTYTEISAVRWMTSQAQGRKYIIATTSIIDGTSVLKELGLPDLPERRAI
ncbi:hypothetical protein FFLO_03363 [Filobasidium floriforme]|uniref:ATP binding protein n=1 Tax=Filobasidium floriforme TaxID=5210 RepID=A0A8K0NNA6_9TREE|nr:Sec1-like protein [Filobasidium floriforme]KAG7544250.1 hypothetical protein FFLO_03363 [Filobasidium floriforme]KAH8085724.1 Sec1-like protein [Filobasidium floriforme]